MNAQDSNQCCPRFDPGPWNDREITWQDKQFLKTHVRSFLHVPLNFGGVMKRAMEVLKSAEACADEPLVVSDENSLWGADVYIAASKPVPGAEMAALSGTFLTRVFDGPYSGMRRWIADMKSFVANRGKTLRKLYFYYTSCPKCAKKYGHNYVVLLAQV